MIYTFDNRDIVVCGDIHGEFNKLVYDMCVRYEMKDTLCIVAGDCGFGFEKRGYYDNIVERNRKRMEESGNRIVFVRGNHDNPAYFDGTVFSHDRFIAVPDYSIIRAGGHSVLCVGGGVSIDRMSRIKANKLEERRQQLYGGSEDSVLPIAYYWENELPVYDEAKLDDAIGCGFDTIVTHTAPSFCQPVTKDGVASWMSADSGLEADMDRERSVMDMIWNRMKSAGKLPGNWYYGHFHHTWESIIDGVAFRMLGISEMVILPPTDDSRNC